MLSALSLSLSLSLSFAVSLSLYLSYSPSLTAQQRVGSFDADSIALFDGNAPPDLTRVAGIITGALQTPLSHTNVRARQVRPNASPCVLVRLSSVCVCVETILRFTLFVRP